jgi:hypothetical protein
LSFKDLLSFRLCICITVEVGLFCHYFADRERQTNLLVLFRAPGLVLCSAG